MMVRGTWCVVRGTAKKTTHHAPRTLLLLALLTTPSTAQVDPSGTWRTLHTEHFRVHFRPAYRHKALEAAAEAERAYRLFAAELHRPRGIIDVTLSDDLDFPNGFTSTYPSNRITILLVPPVSDPGLQTFDSWERLVIVQELAHVFHLDRSRGLWRALQSIFGRAPGLFPNQYQPSWVTEGLATYYESRFTTGGRADGSFHRQVVSADVAAGRARRPWDALLFTRWPAGLAPYAYGSRFYQHTAETAGDSVVPRFIEASAGQFIPFRVGRPLRRAGVHLEPSWQSALATAASPAPARSRLLVGRLRAEPLPRVSPDGRRLAYLHSDGRGAQRIRIIDPHSGAVLRSHRVTGQVSFDWNGDTLVVAQLEFASRWSLRSDLWRWTPDGDWQRLTRQARLLEPRAGGGLVASLRLAPGGNAPTLPADSSGSTWGPVAPSPDGRWLVAARHRTGRWELVRWPAGEPGSSSVLLRAPNGSAIADPVWSRDGAAVLFVTDADGFPQVHRWSEDDGIARLTAEPRGARAPAVLPDGRILFATLGDEGWELRSAEPLALATAVGSARDNAPAFEPAPQVPVRETGYASWGSLRPHFWIPLVLDAGDAGLFFGGATAGVDAVGRYSYFVQGLVAGSPLRAQGSLFLINNAHGNPGLDLSISNDWSLVGTDSTGHVVSSERRDAAFGATFFDRRWRSYISLRIAAEYQARRYVSIPDTSLADICTGCDNHQRLGAVVSLALGSTVAGALSVSPQDGATANLLYRYRHERDTWRWLSEIRGRASAYARLGPRIGFAYPVLALRGAFGGLDGSIPELLSVGGVSSGALDVGFGQSIGTFRTFPVRGYAAGTVRGRSAATFTAEYRVPLALVGRSLGTLPLGADRFALAIFGDIGDAWDPGVRPRLHRLRSVGAELVGDLTISYDVPLRVRLGVAQPATGHTRVYGAFGADF